MGANESVVPPPREKIPRQFSDESIKSHSSHSAAEVLAQGVSRASRLVRMSSTALESRRAEAEAAHRAAVEEATGAAEAELARAAHARKEVVNRLEKIIETRLRDQSDTESVLNLLGNLQSDALKKANLDSYLACVSEVTVRTLLRHLEGTGKEKTRVESLIEENFLVPPEVIAHRRTNAAQKLKDYKLQVLYRAELHWLLANQEKKHSYETEILDHLRKILTLEGTSTGLQIFLQDVVVSSHAHTQPDLLCLLYDELRLPKPKDLVVLFSPAKFSQRLVTFTAKSKNNVKILY